MSMKLKNKLQALRDDPEYRNKFKKYDEYRRKNNIVDFFANGLFIVSEEGRKLCREYKIPYPFNPDSEIEVPPDNQQHHALLWPWRLHMPLEAWLNYPSILPLPGQALELVNNQYLDVRIDMTRPAGDILRDINRLCQRFRGKDRDKASSLTPLDVYKFVEDKRRTEPKRSLLSLAREFLGFKGSISYSSSTFSEKALSGYRRFTRAYNKGEKLLKKCKPMA